MLLSQTAEYALRVVAVLAAAWPDERLRAKDLSERANLPPAYASKVARKLVVGGVVTGVRGHHGGFSLARNPAEIPISEVLDAVDFEVTDNSCAFGVGDCHPEAPCALHPAWSNLKGCFRNWAESTYLDDTTSVPTPS